MSNNESNNETKTGTEFDPIETPSPRRDRQMAKFEGRFQGKDNAGLRAQIREVAKRWVDGSPDDVERAILSLGRTVALSAAGQRTLTEVAEDYRAARMAPKSVVQGVKIGPGWDK